ncbi:LacI family DNA-binding transcriptional regulator [Alteromonas sp. 1_MG-2023]|uniref:LacI family DNA-binding transcriptional regulator n=1 Tax=Alteromonas sp. 1_MG-2023 TaxID=3062669 RepID=UPI0026E388E3|nr:LacI family DNA-binding transcriptional regulator [Alteromonas sp. 1_MG-2023]MDO6474318.1 LacI family DNA-binding transcriptional regulator [Alteromonas sp. 1_MG-2023]
MKTDKNLTVHDVARVAGVSIKTVSRVLNNDPTVRDKNKEKVLSAVAVTGYRPDLNARRLRTGQSYLICLLYFDYVSNSYSSRLVSGAIEVCDDFGFDLMVRPVKDRKSLAEQVRNIAARSNPDGYILTPPMSDDKDVIAVIEEENKSVIKILPMELDDISCVNCDIVAGVREAVNHLLTLGHRRVAILNFFKVRGGLLRYQGYEEAHRQFGLPIDSTLQIDGPMESDEDYERAIRQMLSGEDRPTAFFTFNDYLATLVYKVASQMKLRIPYDLSVIGYDDDPSSKNLWPPLSTVHQPVVNLGRAAAGKLIQQQILKQTYNHSEDLKCRYIQRSSCGPLL